jgi:hypothetical protein
MFCPSFVRERGPRFFLISTNHIQRIRLSLMLFNGEVTRDHYELHEGRCSPYRVTNISVLFKQLNNNNNNNNKGTVVPVLFY